MHCLRQGDGAVRGQREGLPAPRHSREGNAAPLSRCDPEISERDRRLARWDVAQVAEQPAVNRKVPGSTPGVPVNENALSLTGRFCFWRPGWLPGPFERCHQCLDEAGRGEGHGGQAEVRYRHLELTEAFGFLLRVPELLPHLVLYLFSRCDDLPNTAH